MNVELEIPLWASSENTSLFHTSLELWTDTSFLVRAHKKLFSIHLCWVGSIAFCFDYLKYPLILIACLPSVKGCLWFPLKANKRLRTPRLNSYHPPVVSGFCCSSSTWIDGFQFVIIMCLFCLFWTPSSGFNSLTYTVICTCCDAFLHFILE